ncbi:MAG: MATE family efflux transporter [Anaerotruncus sp.]|nr:MAG: MATE family efflux transporter [Anaerotruncus sp.]
MLITTIYNATDTYFVSKKSTFRQAAQRALFFSLMAILQAFGFMFGHGSGSCISRNLGAQNIEKARRYSSTGLFLALLTGALIGILGIIFLAPFMRLLGSTATILPYSKAYGIFILAAGPAMTGSCVANNILRYEGKASLAMVGLTAGGVLNIILDPIFDFRRKKMGIAGAGLSTAISQYISFAILMIMYYKGDAQSKPHIKYITLKPRFVATIITTGLPSLARQGLNSVSNMVLNIEAALYGDACIAAMSIVAKCANLIFSVCVGIGQGFQPVSAFNYGAKKYSRVKSGVKFTWGFSTGVLAALAAACFAFAPQIITVFRHESEVVEIGGKTLRLLCIALLFLPTVMVANMTFQSIGQSGKAFFLACSQNGLFFIPLAIILPKICGITGLELAQPIGYILAAAVSVPFLLRFIKTLTSYAANQNSNVSNKQTKKTGSNRLI